MPPRVKSKSLAAWPPGLNTLSRLCSPQHLSCYLFVFASAITQDKVADGQVDAIAVAGPLVKEREDKEQGERR